jgi:uncharacterized protein
MMMVESPCVRNCCLDDNDICVGCYRSLAEITRWSLVDDNARLQIRAAAAARSAAALSRQQQSGHQSSGAEGV